MYSFPGTFLGYDFLCSIDSHCSVYTILFTVFCISLVHRKIMKASEKYHWSGLGKLILPVFFFGMYKVKYMY